MVYKVSVERVFNNQNGVFCMDILFRCSNFADENNKVLAPTRGE